jgi:hypothetical protein
MSDSTVTTDPRVDVPLDGTDDVVGPPLRPTTRYYDPDAASYVEVLVTDVRIAEGAPDRARPGG